MKITNICRKQQTKRIIPFKIKENGQNLRSLSKSNWPSFWVFFIQSLPKKNGGHYVVSSLRTCNCFMVAYFLCAIHGNQSKSFVLINVINERFGYVSVNCIESSKTEKMSWLIYLTSENYFPHMHLGVKFSKESIGVYENLVRNSKHCLCSYFKWFTKIKKIIWKYLRISFNLHNSVIFR